MLFTEHPLLPEVEARVAASALLRPRVHLRGAVPRSALPAFYAGADLFVMGSHHEAACYSLIEALSFGVTPVVTDIPPFRVLTGEGKLGGTFSPGDAAGLAAALGRLGEVDLPHNRQAVRAHFDRQLSWAAVGARAMEIYRAAVRARQPWRGGAT
jgi:glycosyltransferase involved in cell wall biosynthesis